MKNLHGTKWLDNTAQAAGCKRHSRHLEQHMLQAFLASRDLLDIIDEAASIQASMRMTADRR